MFIVTRAILTILIMAVTAMVGECRSHLASVSAGAVTTTVVGADTTVADTTAVEVGTAAAGTTTKSILNFQSKRGRKVRAFFVLFTSYRNPRNGCRRRTVYQGSPILLRQK